MNALTLRLMFITLATLYAPDSDRPFGIEIVDQETGRGVPLVELRTVNGLRFWSDSNGLVAFHEPGLMDETVFFHIRSHGYEFPKDGFGFRGKALKVKAGETARISIRRVNIAERLYRQTGEGIYRDSILLGKPVPTSHPLLNGRVFGSDSVVNAIYRGKIYWFWGDTNRPNYPLGNFHVPGATSRLPSDGGLDPERGVDLAYQVDREGFARPTAEMPGPGPTWIDGLVVLKDSSGHERMFAAYAKIRNMLDVYERGLVEYDANSDRFQKFSTFPDKPPLIPGGHPLVVKGKDREFIHFATPYPLVRVQATAEDLTHLERYEAFTCLVAGSSLDKPQIDRHPDGSIRYAWKPNTPPVPPGEQAKLIKAGLLKPDESTLTLRDIETGKPVFAHAGSVYWNEFRRRWVMITAESGGTSFLGEIWFAEADTPLGPWVYARKVVTHDKYDFYNPKQHPMFAKEGGKTIFFEGTYTNTFSGNPDATPRYEYNQLMYKLDLSDSRLNLPVPVYELEGETFFGTGLDTRSVTKNLKSPFQALERSKPGTLPVFVAKVEGRPRLMLGRGDNDQAKPIFYVLPHDTKDQAATTELLYETFGPDGQWKGYVTEKAEDSPGTHRAKVPFCRVWHHPLRVELPRD